MKVQARIEKELFRAQERYEHMKSSSTRIENLIRTAEKIKVLTWVLSDLDKDLDEI